MQKKEGAEEVSGGSGSNPTGRCRMTHCPGSLAGRPCECAITEKIIFLYTIKVFQIFTLTMGCKIHTS